MDGTRDGTWLSIERSTWIAGAETLALILLLTSFRESALFLYAGLPLVLHLGWSAATSMPVGRIPGPPSGTGERRRNHLLRYQVVAFLSQVQRVEAAAEKAAVAGMPRPALQEKLQVEGRVLQEIASDMVKVAGRVGV